MPIHREQNPCQCPKIQVCCQRQPSVLQTPPGTGWKRLGWDGEGQSKENPWQKQVLQ